MNRRIWIALGLLAVGGIAGFLITHALAAPPAQLTRDPMPTSLQAVWPTDKTWCWSFPLPNASSGGVTVALRLRARSTDEGANIPSVVRMQSQAMPASQAQREWGTSAITSGLGQPPPAAGSVTVQLLDLAAIGALSDHPGQNLRALGTLAIGGVSTPLSGKDIYLPAGSFDGHTVATSGNWENGELYLMTFYVKAERKRYQYDVFLQQQADRASAGGGK